MMNELDVMRFQLGAYARPVGNADYLVGTPALSRGITSGDVGVGRTSLSMLAVAILGIMAFYAVTRSKQF